MLCITSLMGREVASETRMHKPNSKVLFQTLALSYTKPYGGF